MEATYCGPLSLGCQYQGMGLMPALQKGKREHVGEVGPDLREEWHRPPQPSDRVGPSQAMSTAQGGVGPTEGVRPWCLHTGLALTGFYPLVNASVICHCPLVLGEAKAGEACFLYSSPGWLAAYPKSSVSKPASKLSVPPSSLVFPMRVSPKILESIFHFFFILYCCIYSSKDGHSHHLLASFPGPIYCHFFLSDLTYWSS